MGQVFGWTTLGVILFMAQSAPAIAQDASTMTAGDAASKFGAREYVNDISLSPDGSHVAIVSAAPGRVGVLQIGDLIKGGPLKVVVTSSGDPERLTSCTWSSNTRLACRIFLISTGSGDKLGFARMVSIDSDGSNTKILSARAGSYALGIDQNGGSVIDWAGKDGTGKALMTRVFVPEMTTGSMARESRQGLAVEEVDTTTLRRRVVEEPRRDAVEYISDGHGNVRIMGMQPTASSGYDTGVIHYLYRKKDSRDWLPLGDLDYRSGKASGVNPVAVDPDLDVVYGYDDKDGRSALYKIALDGSKKRDLVLANADVDIDDLIRIGRQQRVVGASFATDRRQVQFFDPALRTLRAALAKALPANSLVSFVDASADEKRLLLFVGSDIDPGRYYLFDKTARKLEEIVSVRPQLDGQKLATVKAINYPAADGTLIPGYLTLPPGSDGKNLPAIVMPHGGPGSRDEWGFDWLSQFFAARGYAVLQPNFRGSTGYGDAWYKENGFRSWRTAIGDVNDAGRWLKSQGISTPGKLAIFGWSYGGYAALQSSVLDPDLFKAIVAVAPVTDLNTLREESRNYANFRLVDAFIGAGPHVTEGSPARNAARIKAPVLLFHGDLDRNVGIGESRMMVSKLKDAGGKVEFVEFPGLDHYLDDSVARTRLLEKSDAFLRAALGL